ncbi:MAG: hypothetical protein ACRD44_04140, partial [Bryobacteraceae bacterium]
METWFADYCTGALAAAGKEQVETHAAACPACARVIETWRLLGSLPAPEPAPALRDRFYTMLEPRAKPAGLEPAAKSSWRPAWAIAACAAALALGWFAGSEWNRRPPETMGALRG